MHIDPHNPPELPNQRRCLVCTADRSGDPMADAIAHAPCDQKLATLDPDTPEKVGFWSSIGQASYDG